MKDKSSEKEKHFHSPALYNPPVDDVYLDPFVEWLVRRVVNPQLKFMTTFRFFIISRILCQ